MSRCDGRCPRGWGWSDREIDVMARAPLATEMGPNRPRHVFGAPAGALRGRGVRGRPRRVIFACIAAVLLVTGCSGGDDDTASGDTDTGDTTTDEGSLTFERTVIDDDPPSGSECCLDVLAVGDVDGDGRADLALGSEGAEGAFWYRNPDWQRFEIGPGDFTTDGRLVDVEGDDDLDFVVSNISEDRIEWWENSGDPTQPSGWEVHTIGDGYAHDVVVGDLSGDDRADVVMFRKRDPVQLTWFEQPADPTGPWVRHELAPGLEGEGLAAGDVDGDGDVDVVAQHILFVNDDGQGGAWTQVDLAEDWGDDVRPAIGDVDGDGAPDVVLAPAEDVVGPIVWVAGPDWTQQTTIDPEDLEGNHTLEVADFDGDGQLDVMAAEMHIGGGRVLVYTNEGGTWTRHVLSSDGSHNARVVDLDGDGRSDIVGKNFDGPKAVEAWINTSSPASAAGSAQSRWTYANIDDDRGSYEGDTPYFGLAFGDLDGDDLTDIASGRYLYLNPGGPMTEGWSRVELPTDGDAMWVLDVGEDGALDVVAQGLPSLYWFEPGADATTWTEHEVVTDITPNDHGNSQGYATAEIHDRPALVMTTGAGLIYVEVPADPTQTPWPTVQITDQPTTEDLLAVGDVDGDGCPDVVGSLDGHDLNWFANPCDGTPGWTAHPLGSTRDWADRAELADLDGDGRLDLVVSDENGDPDGAGTFWFRAPADPTQPWQRSEVVTQASTNAMSVADITGDAAPDIVTGEHKGELDLTVWQNIGAGASWVPELVDSGHESHLGARVVDLDGRGRLGIVSIAWDEPEDMHLWVSAPS